MNLIQWNWLLHNYGHCSPLKSCQVCNQQTISLPMKFIAILDCGHVYHHRKSYILIVNKDTETFRKPQKINQKNTRETEFTSQSKKKDDILVERAYLLH